MLPSQSQFLLGLQGELNHSYSRLSNLQARLIEKFPFVYDRFCHDILGEILELCLYGKPWNLKVWLYDLHFSSAESFLQLLDDVWDPIFSDTQRDSMRMLGTTIQPVTRLLCFQLSNKDGGSLRCKFSAYRVYLCHLASCHSSEMGKMSRLEGKKSSNQEVSTHPFDSIQVPAKVQALCPLQILPPVVLYGCPPAFVSIIEQEDLHRQAHLQAWTESCSIWN